MKRIKFVVKPKKKNIKFIVKPKKKKIKFVVKPKKQLLKPPQRILDATNPRQRLTPPRDLIESVKENKTKSFFSFK